jgi:hypothetical protein
MKAMLSLLILLALSASVSSATESKARQANILVMYIDNLGSIRVPALFRWPRKIPPNTETNSVLSHLDVLPLCLHAAGFQRPEDLERLVGRYAQWEADIKRDASEPIPYVSSTNIKRD